MEPMEMDNFAMMVTEKLLITCSLLVIGNALPSLIRQVCCFKREPDLMETLEAMRGDIEELKNTLRSKDNFIFNTDESDQQSEEQSEEEAEEQLEEEAEEQSEQTEEQSEEQSEDSAETIVKKPEDKHALLRAKLKTGDTVNVTYKKTTFVGIYKMKADSPNGYIIEHNAIEYLTPSQFSFTIKRSLNPNISSDNGWDTVYVNTAPNAQGKPTKASLKELINMA